MDARDRANIEVIKRIAEELRRKLERAAKGGSNGKP